MTGALDRVRLPIVLAPMAGGPGTAALAVAVAQAGGLGFVPGGYRTADQLRADIATVRAGTSAPFGVNLFVPSPDAADTEALARFAERIRPEASALGVPVGEPAWSDDGWSQKLQLLLEERPAVVAFTFGCPPAAAVEQLHGAGIEVWVTVNEPSEAFKARSVGADTLVAQGVEAGGHRGGFSDVDGSGEVGLLPLLRLLLRVSGGMPVVASGGIPDGWAVAAVLAAGARAAQIGTAFLDTDEAGTAPAHRERLRAGAPTRLTRAFSGRRARGLVNGFLERHSAAAPAAYPQVNQMTSPLRAAGREQGDADVLNLWAGQAHALADHGVPAREVMARLERELHEALDGLRLRGLS